MIKANLVDQIAFFRSDKIIGNDGLPFVNNLSLKKISKNAKNTIFENYKLEVLYKTLPLAEEVFLMIVLHV